MTLIVTDTTADMAKEAAKIVADAIIKKPDLVLGLATGSTQIRFYNQLVRMYIQEQLDLSRIITFNLDEYIGIPPSHSHSYRYFMDNHFFNHCNVPEENIHMLSGVTENQQAQCEEYEQAIQEAGGIDIQMLGIGVNGHVAFCEPGTPFDSPTQVVSLKEDTIEENSDGRFYKNTSEVPREVLTMGINTIMNARKIILMANGPRKADAVMNALKGPVTTDVPASVLQTHKDAIWIVEKEAASKI